MKSIPIFLAVPVLVLSGGSNGAEPAATVRQITHGPMHHFFGYVGHGGTIPWNASGRFIVALRTDFHDRMPAPDEAADVVLIDTQNDDGVEAVDRTLAWNLQQGTMLFWIPGAAESRFLFNDKDPETGVVFTVLYDIAERRRVREFRFGKESIANGGVSPARDEFAGINYGKITRSREVISYPGAYDHTADENPANPDSDGLFRVAIGTGESHLLVSYAQLSGLILDTEKNRELLGEPDKYPIYVHHTMWSRDGEWIIFLVRGKQNKRPDQACVIRRDGTARLDDDGEAKLSVRVSDAIRDPVEGFDHVDCAPFPGDAVRHRVRWKGDRSMTEFKRKVVRLEVFLENADLFTIVAE